MEKATKINFFIISFLIITSILLSFNHSKAFFSGKTKKIAEQLQKMPEAGELLLTQEHEYKQALENYFILQKKIFTNFEIQRISQDRTSESLFKVAFPVYREILENYEKLTHYLNTAYEIHKNNLSTVSRAIKASALSELYILSFHDFHYNMLNALFEAKVHCQEKSDVSGSLCASGNMYDLDAFAKRTVRKLLQLKDGINLARSPIFEKIEETKKGLYEQYSEEYESGLLPEFGLVNKAGSANGLNIKASTFPINFSGLSLVFSSETSLFSAIGFDGNYWHKVFDSIQKKEVLTHSNEVGFLDRISQECLKKIKENKSLVVPKDTKWLFCGPKNRVTWPSFTEQQANDVFLNILQKIDIEIYAYSNK